MTDPNQIDPVESQKAASDAFFNAPTPADGNAGAAAATNALNDATTKAAEDR